MNNANEAGSGSAGKLRPLDAANRKPGDPVVRLTNDGTVTHGRFIAYVPDAAPEYRALVKFEDHMQALSYTEDGRFVLGLGPTAFLPPLDPLDEIDPSPGNVARLTRRQVGEGYRIASHDEPRDPRAECWKWYGWIKAGTLPASYAADRTYRAPIDPPAPRMVPLDQSDIVLGKTVVRRPTAPERKFLVLCVNDRGVFIQGFEVVREWEVLRDLWDISFDHGVTWQRAEKPEPEGGAK